MSKARKLFQERPYNLVEHPTDLPTDNIPEGMIEGWWAFAPQMNGDPGRMIGPFVPVVSKPYDDDQPCIETEDGTQFWFHAHSDDLGRPGVPCWFQSGSTLRFVRTKENPRQGKRPKLTTAQSELLAVLDRVANTEGTTEHGALRDILTDLRYVADALGLDFDAAVIGSTDVYVEETEA